MVQPEPAQATSLALSLLIDGQVDAALVAIDAALARRKDALGYFIRGRILDEKLAFRDAIDSYRRSLSRDPRNRKTKFYLGLAYLTIGDFERGSRFYPFRLTPEQLARFAGVRAWTPRARPGHVLLWAEQGIGDEIMFCQLLPLVQSPDFTFTVECDRRLTGLLQANFPAIRFIERGAAPGAIDYHLPIGGLLAHYHDALRAGALPRPSLTPPARPDIAARAAALKAGGKRLIGLSWLSASEDHGARRSVAVETLCGRLDPARHAIAILQYLPPQAALDDLAARGFDCIADVDTFLDVEATLALIAGCDQVITIDNSVAHFAGAIGADTHVLLPEVANWRWGESGTTSYWYDRLTLHRKTPGRSWADLVDGLPIQA